MTTFTEDLRALAERHRLLELSTQALESAAVARAEADRLDGMERRDFASNSARRLGASA
jgi:hypothetical protein